jgi:hypothetical protein
MIAGRLLFRGWLDFDSSKLEVDFFSEGGLVLLDDGRTVVDVLIVGRDDSSFSKVVQSSTVASFFHIEQLFAIPGVEVDGLDERVDDPVLTVFSSAVEAEMYAEMDGGPLGVLLLAVKADLTRASSTLLSLMFLIAANTLSLVSSSTVCIPISLPVQLPCSPLYQNANYNTLTC